MADSSTALEPGAAQDPTLCFPDELLGEIFIQLLDEFRWNSRYPFIVAAACRRWRAVALRTPALWTIVKYTISENDVFPQNRWARCFNIHLERSRARLLHVDVYWRADCGVVPDLYNAVLALLRRAGTFALRTTRDLGAHVLLGDAPHLTECRLARAPDDTTSWPLFLCAPRLESFEYRGYRLLWADAQELSTFPRVTKVSLHVWTFTPNNFVTIFSRYFQHIEDFSLTVRNCHYLGYGVNETLTAPHLRTFKLSLPIGILSDAPSIPNFDFPVLHTAGIYVGDYVPGDVISPILRSGARTIEVLHLEVGNTIQEDSLLDGISVCANLRHVTLSVGVHRVRNEVLATLEQPAVCPRLESLVLKVAPPFGAEPREVLSSRLETLAEVRRPVLKRIELVAMALYTKFDLDIAMLQQRLDTILLSP